MSKPHQVNNILGYVLLFVLIIGLDQGVKYIAPGIVPVFHNKGLALGVFPNYSVYLVILGFILLIQVIAKNYFSSASALLLAGALSNLIDRLRFSYVVDYIDLKYLPVFNIADIAIVLGAIFLIGGLLFQKKSKKYG